MLSLTRTAPGRFTVDRLDDDAPIPTLAVVHLPCRGHWTVWADGARRMVGRVVPSEFPGLYLAETEEAEIGLVASFAHGLDLIGAAYEAETATA